MLLHDPIRHHIPWLVRWVLVSSAIVIAHCSCCVCSRLCCLPCLCQVCTAFGHQRSKHHPKGKCNVARRVLRQRVIQRWHLYVMLIRNPSLQLYRKHRLKAITSFKVRPTLQPCAAESSMWTLTHRMCQHPITETSADRDGGGHIPEDPTPWHMGTMGWATPWHR